MVRTRCCPWRYVGVDADMSVERLALARHVRERQSSRDRRDRAIRV
jgi:hypothetical protein